MTRRTGRSLLAAGVALVVVTGCGAQDDGDDDPSSEGTTDVPSQVPSEYQPSETASPDMVLAEAPSDFTEIEGEGFTISAPGDFQQQRETSSNGEPMLVLELPSAPGGVPERVAVIRDVGPDTAAPEQSFALESSKSAGGAAAEATRVELDVPEGQTAFLITWKETVGAGGSGGTEVTYWQLMQQVSPDLILNVVALAPSAAFDSSEVSTILRSFVAAAPA